MAPPTTPRGHGLDTLGPVGREAALYGGISARDQSDELTSRVWPAIQADYLRAYHRPRKKEKDSSSWALVRSVGRKISGLWPFWSEGVRGGEDDESVIARRRLGKSSRRLRPPPRPPMRHSRGRYNGGMMLGPPRLDRGPMVGALWSVSVDHGDEMVGEDDYMSYSQDGFYYTPYTATPPSRLQNRPSLPLPPRVESGDPGRPRRRLKRRRKWRRKLDSLESLLLTDLTSQADDLAVDSTSNNGLDNGGVVDVCAEFGECDHIYEFPSIVEEEAVDSGVEDRGGGSVDVPEGADLRFEQVYPDKELPYYRSVIFDQRGRKIVPPSSKLSTKHVLGTRLSNESRRHYIPPSSKKSTNVTVAEDYDQEVGGSSNFEAVTVADNDSINLMIALEGRNIDRFIGTKPRKRKNRPGGGSGVGMLTPHGGYQFQGKPQFRSIFGGGRVNRKDKVKKPKSKKKKKRVKPLWSGVRFYKPNGEQGTLGRQDFLRSGGGYRPVDTIILRRRTSNNLTPGALALLPAVLCGGLICGMLLGNGYGPVDTLNNITINLPDIANTFDPTNTVEVMNTNDDTDVTTVTGMNTNNVMRRSFDFETQIDDWESLMDDEEAIISWNDYFWDVVDAVLDSLGTDSHSFPTDFVRSVVATEPSQIAAEMATLGQKLYCTERSGLSADCSDRVVCEHISTTLDDPSSVYRRRNVLLRSGGLFLVTLAKWKGGSGSGFEEAASMMAAAAQNECPARFACDDVMGAEKSGCLDDHRDDGDVPNVLDLSGLLHFSED